MAIALKRAYDPPAETDGLRVLVDRVWPRGVTKSAAKIDLWMKEIAPSTDLRKWFGHDPKRWHEFRRRYQLELKEHREAVMSLKHKARQGTVTLVYGARDPEHNQAVVLKSLIEKS